MSAHSAIFSTKLEYRPVWSQTTSRRKCTNIYNFSTTLATFETCFNNMNDKNTCYLPTGTYLETINTSNRQTRPERAVLFPFRTKSNVRDVTRSTNHCKRRLPSPPPRWLRGNSSWGGVNYNQISFQWWSQKKLEFWGEGKEKIIHAIFALSPQEVNANLSFFRVSSYWRRAGVGWC